MGFDAQTGLSLIEIIWINLLLSGDNAVVIALACRGLPTSQQKWGIILGTAPAVALRVLFALFVIYLMEVPYLKVVGGLLLLWIAVKLLQPERQMHGRSIKAPSLFAAVRTIVVADVVMSLDNVVALAAAAQGRIPLLVVGLAISMPLVILGSALLLKLLTRFPVFVTAGGALLGFIAGQTVMGDAAFANGLEQAYPLWSSLVPIACAIGTVVAGRGLAYRAANRGCKRAETPPET